MPKDDSTLTRTGRVLNRHKMAKPFELAINAGRLSWTRVEESIRKERELDGI